MWGDNVDVGIVRDATGAGFPLRGRGSFRLEAHGDAERPVVECRASLANGEVDSLSFDRIEFAAAYDGKEYSLQRLHVVDGADSVDVTGWWRTPTSPVAVVRGEADWTAMLGSPFHAEVEPHGFSLAALGRALHRPLALGGVLSGRVVMDGTPDDPRIRVAADVAPRPGYTLALPHGKIAAEYAQGELTLSALELHGDVDATISGTLPVRVSLTRGVGVDRDAPVALDLRIRQSESVARLGGYWSRLSELDGHFKGDVSIRGSIARPRFGGEVAMDGGVIQVAGMVERFQNASARVKFVDNVVRLASIDAKSDRGGTVHGSGSLVLDGWKPASYRADLTLGELWMHSIPNLESLQDGRLTVTSIEWQDGRRIPSITGKVSVREASLSHVLDTGGGTQRASLTLPTSEPGWVCSIDIDAPKNVWIRDPDLRMELGGQLILKRDETGMYLRGNLNVLRGQYSVYGNKFSIIDGTLNFSTALLRPEIQINAYTPHRTSGGFERRIYLNLSWPHDQKEPTVTLSYDDPGYYESDIWRMLGGSDIAGGLAANTLERVLNEQMSDVSIEIGQRETRRQTQVETPEQEMMIGVGKYLWQDVYLRYRQGLTLTTSREVEVEYRLSNMFLIRSELVRYTRRNYVGANRQTLDEFNLDIRLRWEF
jgi:translocation and assembly module TamB